MNLETIELIVLALCGFIMYVIVKFQRRKDKSTSFDFKWWLNQNAAEFLLSFVSMVVIFIMKDKMSNMLGMQFTDESAAPYLFSFLGGYLNHSLIDDLLKTTVKTNG